MPSITYDKGMEDPSASSRLRTGPEPTTILTSIAGGGRAHTAALEVVQRLREHGYSAYFVGGCVRDLLLGIAPQDYDVATDAQPEQVMDLFPETIPVGAQFGVVLVVCREASEGEKPIHVEVATYRSDIGYSDGRHPDAVRYSKTPQEDVQRRDFTINGLLLDPIQNKVLDYVGGRSDLQNKTIRAIGNPLQRFREDKLRMMRAVRFAARLSYEIEPTTMAAICELARDIHQVSRERIRDELDKMLTEGRARRCFELLDTTGLLIEVLPEVRAMKGVEQPPQYHPEGDVWTHTLLLLEGLEKGCSKSLAWGVLLHDVGKPPTFRIAPDRIRFDQHAEVGTRMAEEICRRLRFPNEITEQVSALVANHMRFADVKKMKESTLKRFLRLPRFEEHLELHRLDCSASHRDLSLYEYARHKLQNTPEEEIRPAPLVTGDDLIQHGWKSGPQFRVILQAVEDAQLEGVLHTREEAISFVETNFSREQS
ncbi:MAG TPA: CCA tRNA nucleotidyltransferase [Terriglobales bacterium]|nr:CCA tRNA nucleotidyltransferase [Terriglobales bacterium]